MKRKLIILYLYGWILSLTHRPFIFQPLNGRTAATERHTHTYTHWHQTMRKSYSFMRWCDKRAERGSKSNRPKKRDSDFECYKIAEREQSMGRSSVLLFFLLPKKVFPNEFRRMWKWAVKLQSHNEATKRQPNYKAFIILWYFISWPKMLFAIYMHTRRSWGCRQHKHNLVHRIKAHHILGDIFSLNKRPRS